MTCVCGYEQQSGIDDNGKYQEFLIGDQQFIEISGSTFKILNKYYDYDEVYLFVCPKCNTVKMVS